MKVLSTKHLKGDRKIINGIKVIILKADEPTYQPPKRKKSQRKNKGLYS